MAKDIHYKNLIFLLFLLGGLTASAQDIFRTVCQGNVDRLDSLLQYVPIDTQDSRGRTLLHWAIGCDQMETFQYLIDHGIDINIADNQDRTPMHTSVQLENQSCFNTLSALQPDQTWINSYGTDLLEIAILNKNFDFVKSLLNLGVDINETNDRGSTPLEIADRISAKKIYDLLMDSGADESKVRKITMHGKYMGQEPPGSTPSLFAPNFISTEESEFGSVFNRAGTEFYFGVDVKGKSEIRYTSLVNSEWSRPEVLLSHDRYGYNDPFLSNDESRLYFISKRAMDGTGDLKDHDIWYVQKTDDRWSEPINAGPNINSEGNEYYISFTNEGTMYFASNGHGKEDSPNTGYDIYHSNNINGIFQEAVRLSDAINSATYEADVFVSPDESYLIFCSTREGGFGQGDLYISFRDSHGHWTPAVNMGEEINTVHYEYCPFVSKDSRYLFYTSNQDIYWVNTEVIDRLREVRR